jgi:hypothetical protein
LSDAMSEKPVQPSFPTWDRTILSNPMSDKVVLLIYSTWYWTMCWIPCRTTTVRWIRNSLDQLFDYCEVAQIFQATSKWSNVMVRWVKTHQTDVFRHGIGQNCPMLCQTNQSNKSVWHGIRQFCLIPCQTGFSDWLVQHGIGKSCSMPCRTSPPDGLFVVVC